MLGKLFLVKSLTNFLCTL